MKSRGGMESQINVNTHTSTAQGGMESVHELYYTSDNVNTHIDCTPGSWHIRAKRVEINALELNRTIPLIVDGDWRFWMGFGLKT